MSASTAAGASSSSSSAAGAPTLFSTMATMQKFFLEGKLCDAVIKVTLDEQQQGGEERKEEEQTQEPPPKRSRGKGKGRQQPKQEPAAAAVDNRISIPVHTLLLCSRSPYFASALTGGTYQEAQTKTVEITLADKEAVEDLKLLIKLSYGASYMRDGDALVPRATRPRLLHLANASEFRDALTEILPSLGEDLSSLEEAITCLEEIPQALSAHEAMANLKLRVVKALADGIDELVRKQV